MVAVGGGGRLQFCLFEVRLSVGLHQLHKEAMVLAVDVGRLARPDIQFIEGDLLIVSALRILFVAGSDGRMRPLYLLHLL